MQVKGSNTPRRLKSQDCPNAGVTTDERVNEVLSVSTAVLASSARTSSLSLARASQDSNKISSKPPSGSPNEEEKVVTEDEEDPYLQSTGLIGIRPPRQQTADDRDNPRHPLVSAIE